MHVSGQYYIALKTNTFGDFTYDEIEVVHSCYTINTKSSDTRIKAFQQQSNLKTVHYGDKHDKASNETQILTLVGDTSRRALHQNDCGYDLYGSGSSQKMKSRVGE